MKRTKHRIPRRYDPNVHLAYNAGWNARIDNKPLTACPNLIPHHGEVYAAELMDSWMRGWHDQDRLIRTAGGNA